MTMLLGLDIHRQQITFDALDLETGEVERGRIAPATRARLRVWLARYAGRELAAALEAPTGWRFVAEELQRVGAGVHLAEPAETAAKRAPKAPSEDRPARRSPSARAFAGGSSARVVDPACAHPRRSRVRLRKALVDERSAWQRRIRACLFHEGSPRLPELLSVQGRARSRASPCRRRPGSGSRSRCE